MYVVYVRKIWLESLSYLRRLPFCKGVHNFYNPIHLLIQRCNYKWTIEFQCLVGDILQYDRLDFSVLPIAPDKPSVLLNRFFSLLLFSVDSLSWIDDSLESSIGKGPHAPWSTLWRTVSMGVGSFFQGGALGDFSKIFPREGQKWQNLIFHSRN